MCANKDACPAQQQRRMAHWVSRKAGDVDAVGASILDKLTDVGLIEKPSDLYTLTYEQLMPDDEPAFEGLGQRSAARIIESVEKSKDMGLRRAIIGWSIPLASEGTAKRLCRA
jgi:DNA ligase (NAD+)